MALNVCAAAAVLLVLSRLAAGALTSPHATALALLPTPLAQPHPHPHPHPRRALHDLPAGRRPKRKGLIYYGFPVAALADSPLDPASLSRHVRAALTSTSTTNVLALLRYAAGCALKPSQNVTAALPSSPAGQQALTLRGSLGLAPNWAHYPLSPEQRRYVTACLAARTNLLGAKVVISLRIPDYHPSEDPDERARFSVLEGAFWGNMFHKRAPGMYSCTGPDADTPRHAQRFCAHGRPSPAPKGEAAGGADAAAGTVLEYCGDIKPMGPCSEVCSGLGEDGYAKCDGKEQVMSVFLPAETRAADLDPTQ